jgi:hypothetical protein
MNKREAPKPRKPAHVGHLRAQSKARVAVRRVEVAALLLRGLTYRVIATKVGVKSTKTIFDDVEAVIGEWRKEQKHNVDEWVALELSKIGRIETQAWDAWERSQRDEETVSTETATVTIKTGRGKEGLEVPALQNRETRTRRGQSGDPRFLTVVLKCVVKRCELLGLDKPKKLDLGNGKVIFLMPDNGRGDAKHDAAD